MKPLLHLLRFPPVAATLALAVLWLAYSAWLDAGGAARLTPDELPADGSAAPLEVELRFRPEAFHMTRLQDIGRLIRVEDRSVFLMDVDPEAARTIARNYWITDIRPWDGI